MKKTVHIQVIDPLSNTCQHASISEPVDDIALITNATLRFGLNYGDIEWKASTSISNPLGGQRLMMQGVVKDCDKYISVIVIY